MKTSDLIECCDVNFRNFPTGLLVDSIENFVELHAVFKELFPNDFCTVEDFKQYSIPKFKSFIIYQLKVQELEIFKKYLYDKEFNSKFNEHICYK